MVKPIRACFDLTGHQFGKWKVIDRVDPPEHLRSNRHKSYWLCKCKCGYESVVLGHNLRHGRSKSCGCGTLQKKEELREFHGRMCSLEERYKK